MKVAIIGTGYVGLPTGVGLAELGNMVTCIDRDESKINALKEGKITLFEEGLEDLFHKNIKAGRIRFTTSMKEGVESADLVIIAVGTPPHPITSYEYPCAFEIGKNERYYPIPTDKNQKLYNRYLAKASELKNVYFIGRLGDYKYYNMDQAVSRSLNLLKQ